MRVIAGTHRGRKLECPEGLDIRPTTDRVKENIFNILSPKVPFSNFLDLFSGSGAIGIEALSRGASEVSFVDAGPESIKALRKNLAQLKIEEHIKIYSEDINIALEHFDKKEKFDIIFMDPPYKKGHYQMVLEKLAGMDILAVDGIIVVERHEEDPWEEFPHCFERIKERKYGTIVLDFYQKKA